MTSQSVYCAATLFSVGCLLWKIRRMLCHSQMLSTVSAPGKVLIAGGYAILDDGNVGVAVATTSRFFTSIVKQISGCQLARVMIEVESPQFGESYVYYYDWFDKKLHNGSDGSNEFIGKCLFLALAFAFHFGQNHLVMHDLRKIYKLKIKLRADNDFYSRIRDLQSKLLPLTSDSLKQFPKFFAPPKGCGQLSKTGLGSSAALAASLVAALLHTTGVVDMTNPDKEMLRLVHNLSQLAHALAQGKIGSGFDVSSAIYGSQIYSRFSAAGIDALTLIRDDGSCDDDILFYTVMQPTIWNQTMVQLSLPPHMDLVLGDVCGGSSSTSMARAVLQWRRDYPLEANRLWKRLVAANTRICEYLLDVNTCAEVEKVQISEWETTIGGDGREVVDKLLGLKRQFSIARQLLKQIGEEAKVGIEPDEQTRLINATESLNGVLAAGVPGAGGVDAIFAVTISENGRKEVEALWSTYCDNGSVVCPLLLRAAEPHSGIKYERNICY